jgi:C_GCAxxG_C_C family probable redox protein
MSAASEAAKQLFSEGYNCAQAVAGACGSRYGLDRIAATRAALAFGGGMGRSGEVCGAVTGALMVIGYACSAGGANDAATKDRAAALARDVMARFRVRSGSLACRDLLGCDISMPDGHRQAADKGLFKTICPKAVEDAALILEKVLAEK